MACTMRMRRLVNIWIVAAISLLISIGAVAAQATSGEPAAQAKRIVVLYSYGQNFQAWATLGQRDPQRTEPPFALAAGHSKNTPSSQLGMATRAAEDAFVEVCEGALCSTTARFNRRSWLHPLPASFSSYRADLFPTTPMLLAAVEPAQG